MGGIVTLTGDGTPGGEVSILYLNVEPNSDHTTEPYPTIDPNGGFIPVVYDVVYNTLFGTIGAIQGRDALATLNPSDPNIAGYSSDSFLYGGTEIFVPSIIMNDGSRWYDLTGDGHAETHIAMVGGNLFYDSDLNGTYDTIY
jgi:hypothetical protein